MKIANINLFLSILFLHSCSGTDMEETFDRSNTRLFTLTNTLSDNPYTEKQAVNAYLFKDGIFRQMFSDIHPDGNKSFTLNIPHTNGQQIYFLSGLPANTEGTLQPGVTKEETFLSQSVGLSGEGETMTAYSFLSAALAINDNSNAAVSVPLIRGTARLDIDAGDGVSLIVDSLQAESFASRSYLMPREGCYRGENNRSWRKTFDTPPVGLQTDVWRMYESEMPATINFYVRVNNTPYNIPVVLPAIRRNYTYTIRLHPQGTSFEGTVDTTPWENGNEVNGSGIPDTACYIDREKSIFPADIQVDYEANSIFVPYMGGEFVLALANMPSPLIEIKGDNPAVAITELEKGKYGIKIKPQSYNAGAYEVRIYLKPETEESYSKYIHIRIEGGRPPSTTLSTVVMGGMEWMSFNSLGADAEKQILSEYEQIEDNYRLNWANSLGKFFQWGRPAAFDPWDSTITNGAGGPTGVWNQADNSPCPQGFRIPSDTEWRQLLPAGVRLPGVYTSGTGESITATLVEALPSTMLIHGYKADRARYLKLVSAEGNVLIFPLGGHKDDKAYAANPQFGSGIHYWTNKDAGRGYATPVRFWPGSGKTAEVAYNTKPREGYCYIRCIKED